MGSKRVTFLFLVVFLGATGLLVRLLWVFRTPIVLAFVLVSLFQPVHRRIRARLGGRERRAALVTTLGVVLVVIVPLAGISTALVGQAVRLYENVRDAPWLNDAVSTVMHEGELSARLSGVLERVGLEPSAERLASIEETFRDVAGDVGTQVGLLLYDRVQFFARNAALILVDFAIMLVVLFTLFVDGERLKAFLFDLSPLPDDQEELLARRFGEMSRAIFLGIGTVSLLQGFFGGLGFVLFGLGPGIFWGSVIAFLAFLPVFGAMGVAVPVAVVTMLEGRVGLGVAFLLYNLAYVAVFEYTLKPLIIGDRIRMNPILVFLAITAGLALFGVLGLFYGPLIVAMFLTLADLYRKHYRDLLVDTVPVPAPAVRSSSPSPPPAAPRGP